MGENRKPAESLGDRREPSMAKLLDPVAWEARLSEARSRRAAALARRRPPSSGPAFAAANPRGFPLEGRSPAFAPAAADAPRPDPAGPAAQMASDIPSTGEMARDFADHFAAAPGPSATTVPASSPLVRAAASGHETAAAPRDGQRGRLAALFITGLVLGLAAAAALSTGLLERVAPPAPTTPDATASEARAADTALALDWVPATAPAGDLVPVQATEAAPAAAAAAAAPADAADPVSDPPPPALAAPASDPALPAPTSTAEAEAEPAMPAAALASIFPLDPPPAEPVPPLAADPATAPDPGPAGIAEADAAAPATADLRPRPRPARGEPLATASAAGESEPQSAAAAQSPARVTVHVPTRASESRTDAVVAALAEAGVPPTGAVRVPMTIGQSNIRFYFPEDAAAAGAMAATLAAATGTTVEPRDFTSHRPRPSPGTLEVWLAGEGAPASATARAPLPQQAAEQALRDLEVLAAEVARAIERSLRN
jgi:hypothetical protein